MAQRQPKKSVDTTILSDVDIQRVQKKAAEQVQGEIKKVVETAYLEQQVWLERAKHEPIHALVDVMINLPGYTKYMLIDGVYYNHGDLVSVPVHMATSITDNMARAWTVERMAGNPNMRDYAPVKNDSFSALSAGRV